MPTVKRSWAEADKNALAIATESSPSEKRKEDAPSFEDPGTLVKFIVGSEGNQKGFMVHKEFACYYSPVFNAAFNSDFIEGQTQTYTLEDTTHGTFRFLLQYIYGQKLLIRELGELSDLAIAIEYEEADETNLRKDGLAGTRSFFRARGEEGFEEHVEVDTEWPEFDERIANEEISKLVELWVLADKLGMPGLQDFTIRGIHCATKTWKLVPTHVIPYVYENTSEDSPLRKFFVDQCACRLGVSLISYTLWCTSG